MFAEDTLKARVPISYEGVLAGYRARANDWETRAALQDDGTFDYYRFWDWFRIGAILSVLVRERKTLSLAEAGFDLTYAYLKGIAHRVVPAGEASRRADLRAARLRAPRRSAPLAGYFSSS